MKEQHAIYTLFLLLSLLCSCNGGKYPQYLLEADSLCMTNPDSALTLLKSKEKAVKAESEASRMYFWLLIAESEDKTHTPSSTDSVIDVVTDFYSQRGTPLLQVRSLYISGRKAFNSSKYASSISHFKNVIRTDVGNDSMGNIYKAKASCWLGSIYEKWCLYDKYLLYNKYGLEYAKRCNSNEWKALALCNIARYYRYVKKDIYSIKYYKKAYMISSENGNEVISNIIANELTATYIDLGMLAKARSLLQTIAKKHEDTDYAQDYFVRAYYYQQTGQYDSAVYYNKEGIERGDLGDKAEAYLDMARIYVKSKELQQALQYYENYAQAISEIDEKKGPEYSDFVSNFEHQLEIEQQNVKLMKDRSHYILIYCTLFCAFFVFVFVIIRYIKEKRRFYIEQQKHINDYWIEHRKRDLQSIRDNEQRIKHLEHALLTSNEQLSDTQRKLLESESSILELKNKQYVLDKERQTLLINDFKTSEIYKKYHDAKSPLPASDRHELITCIDNTFNNFSHRLTKLYPKMRDDELYICCMIKTGLSPKEISNITMLKPNSLSMTRTRLYQKIFGKKGSATDFDSFIRSF